MDIHSILSIVSLEFVLFASSWGDDCCWWLIKVSFAVFLLFSNVGLGELGSRSLLPVIGWTYRFDALIWLCTSSIVVSELPELRLVLFFVSQKVVTRPGKDEGSLVICVGVWFVTRVGEDGILLDLKIFRAVSGVISWVGGLLSTISSATKHLNACSWFSFQLFLYLSWREVHGLTWLLLYPWNNSVRLFTPRDLREATMLTVKFWMMNIIFLLETSSDILSSLFVKCSLLSIKICSFDLCMLSSRRTLRL